MTTRNMICCICGGSAGRWQQHWNRDTGFGVCVSCIETLRSKGTSEAEIADFYGKEGVNWGGQSNEPTEADHAALRLFNCCPNHATPDWSLFAWLEIGGCTTEKDPKTGKEFTNGGVSDDEAEFWTVYGRLKEGGCEAITDCTTRSDANMAADTLSRLSNLPLH